MIKIFRHKTCAAWSGKEVTRLESAVSVAFWGTLLPPQLSLLHTPSVWSPPLTYLAGEGNDYKIRRKWVTSKLKTPKPYIKVCGARDHQ